MSGVGRLTMQDIKFIGLVLEGLFYGLYSAIFFMYIQCQASKEGIGKTRNVLVYLVCLLYILSTATFVLDIIVIIFGLLNPSPGTSKLALQALVQELHFTYASTTVNALCDFISQSILIYRCWVMWSCNIGIIIIPAILTLTFLATWLATSGSFYIVPLAGVTLSDLGNRLCLTSLFISLIVNAVATGLIVLRILKVYWQVGRIFGVEDQTLDVGGTTPKLWSIIWIIIESGMTMFAVQLIRVVLTFVQLAPALSLIVAVYQMFNGITPTIILVRVSMGLSYHDEKSMVETIGSLWFVSQNSILGAGGIDIADQETKSDSGIQQGDDIEVMGG